MQKVQKLATQFQQSALDWFTSTQRGKSGETLEITLGCSCKTLDLFCRPTIVKYSKSTMILICFANIMAILTTYAIPAKSILCITFWFYSMSSSHLLSNEQFCCTCCRVSLTNGLYRSVKHCPNFTLESAAASWWRVECSRLLANISWYKLFSFFNK